MKQTKIFVWNKQIVCQIAGKLPIDVHQQSPADKILINQALNYDLGLTYILETHFRSLLLAIFAEKTVFLLHVVLKAERNKYAIKPRIHKSAENKTVSTESV